MKETKLTLKQVTEMWLSGERTINENKKGFHLHKYNDVIEYNELKIKGNEIPFIAYEKCIYCDKKRHFVNGWIDVADVMNEFQKEIKK